MQINHHKPSKWLCQVCFITAQFTQTGNNKAPELTVDMDKYQTVLQFDNHKLWSHQRSGRAPLVHHGLQSPFSSSGATERLEDDLIRPMGWALIGALAPTVARRTQLPSGRPLPVHSAAKCLAPKPLHVHRLWQVSRPLCTRCRRQRVQYIFFN